MLPERCPLGADGSACRVGIHHHRARKTGPRIPLAVARCRQHRVTFTVYPPGHVPYGRAAVVPRDSAGREVRTAEGSRAWSGTVFEAARDAAAAVRWPVHRGAPADRRTQGRWLDRAGTLLGLDLGLGERTRERIASALDVPLLRLRDRPATSWRSGGSWTDRGRAVGAVLEQVREPTQLLLAGHVAGLWGRPSRWDPGGRTLRPLV